jgi:hypothetical protein
MSIDDQPCTFSYGPSPETPDSKKPEAVDPAKHPEWIALAEHFRHNESMMAEARRVDPMPDPSVITVGQTIDFVDLIARTPQDWVANPEIGQMIMSRELVLSASPGWKAFKKWSDIEHHRRAPLAAAKELLALLVDRLRRPSDELRLMPLLEAVGIVCQPEAAGGPPSGTNPVADQLYLPKPDTLTVGQMARLLHDQAKSWERIEQDPARTVPDDFVMRNTVLVECPAYHDFVGLSNRKLGRDADFKAADKLFSRLSKKTGMLRAEIDLLPLADAMRMLMEAPPATVSILRPKILRGRLDETAAIELKKNPNLTFKQLASVLGCREGTLRDKAKCPLLAAVKARLSSERDRFRNGSCWQDRRPDDDDA